MGQVERHRDEISWKLYWDVTTRRALHNLTQSVTQQLESTQILPFQLDPNIKMVFTLKDRSITVDQPPWQARITELLSEEQRIKVWGRIRMAEARVYNEESLFTFSGEGATYALTPSPRSLVPLQWAQYGPGAIPDSLADMPSSSMDAVKLLSLLNSVLATDYTLEKAGLRQCLEHFLSSVHDFGEIYGCLRDHWYGDDFANLLTTLAAQREHDEASRWDAVQSDYVSKPNLSPRRVWDLFSNRVIPWHTLRDASTRDRPPRFCTVSHSWVAENERRQEWTPINGHAWPVPLPQDATLEHVRVELLNLGAEYAWLDVLCLRQWGRPEDEPTRQAEWRLDVPTIGALYAHIRVWCLTYFNGLGRPFDPSPALLASDRHWLNRVWTLQEATDKWMPGGMTGAPSPEAMAFFRGRYAQTVPPVVTGYSRDWRFALAAMQGRSSTTPLDSVHGLAYILQCNTLPVYEEGMTVELAWAVLLKHVDAWIRKDIALAHLRCYPESTALLPSWDDFRHANSDDVQYGTLLMTLNLIADSQLGALEPGTYYQEINSCGPFILKYHADGSTDSGKLELGIPDSSRPPYIFTCRLGGSITGGKSYRLLQLDVDSWLVVETVGERMAEGDRMFEVVKRGSILFANGVIPDIAGWVSTSVIYLNH